MRGMLDGMRGARVLPARLTTRSSQRIRMKRAGLAKRTQEPHCGAQAGSCRTPSRQNLPLCWPADFVATTVMSFEHIAIIGAGAWGTALANAIARAGRSVLLAARNR